MEQKLSEQELVRRQKMEDLRAKGIDPFGHAFARTHRSAQLREEYGEVSQEELEEKKRFVLAFKTEMPLSRQLEKYSEHMELLRKQSERLKHVKEKLEERIEERRHE